MNNNFHTSVSKRQKGFTLVELLIYMGVLTIFITGAIQFGWNSINAEVKSGTQQEVLHNLRFATNRITYEIRNASDSTVVNTDDVCLSSTDTSRNPTRIYLSSGRLRIGWGGGSSDCSNLVSDYPLTGNDVNVSDLTVTQIVNGIARSIGITMSIGHNNPSGRPEWDFQQTYTTTVKLRQ